VRDKFDLEGLNLLVRDRIPENLEYHFYEADDGGLGLEIAVDIAATAEVRPDRMTASEMTVDQVADALLVAATTVLCTTTGSLARLLHVLHLVLDGEVDIPHDPY
jgi:hypothetical protein